VHAHIEDGIGEVLVRDDDGSTSTNNAISIGDARVIEGDGGTHYAYVPLTLSVPPTTTVKVTVLSACGTSGDPAPASQTISFTAGHRVKMLKYQIVADRTPEQTQVENKKIKLKVGNAVVTVPTGSITIDDNDSAQSPDDEPYGPNELVSQSSDAQI